MEQISKQRKVPERQCLGCNEHKPKRELLRVVRTPEGEIVLDIIGLAEPLELEAFQVAQL